MIHNLHPNHNGANACIVWTNQDYTERMSPDLQVSEIRYSDYAEKEHSHMIF